MKIDRLIVVQNSDDLNISTVEKFARIVVRESRETWRDYEGIPRVTWIGPISLQTYPWLENMQFR